MLARIRPVFLTALVALSLVISGQAIALAKGASPATGHMVLCTGHGPVVLFTDANGDPTAPPHMCPDCTLAALSAAPEAHAVPLALDARARPVVWTQSEQAIQTSRSPTTQARAPPFPV